MMERVLYGSLLFALGRVPTVRASTCELPDSSCAEGTSELGLSEDVLAAAERAEPEEGLELLQVQVAASSVREDDMSGGDADLSLLDINASEGSRWADERCKMAVEGTNCVPSGQDPADDPNMWTHITYCSGFRNNRYRLWRRDKSCEDERGAFSRCKMTGSMLASAQCDDPFCRTREDGRYCSGGNLVLCQGDDEPKVVEYCGRKYEHSSFQADDDGDYEEVECTKTRSYMCEEHPEPTCAFTGESSRCDISRRRNGRRRCSRDDDYDEEDYGFQASAASGPSDVEK